jgi:TonB family protein
VAGAGRRASAKRGGRRGLLLALVASVLFHLGLLVLVRALPAVPHRRLQEPVSFTLVERPARHVPHKAPSPLPVPRPGSSGARPGGQPGAGEARASGPSGIPGAPDVPYAQNPKAAPSLQSMSEHAAEAVVKQRGPRHAPGDSIGERLAETLQRGTGAMAVERSGFWDAYFTLLRKAVLAAWSAGKPQAHFAHKATTRIRLVLDADGLLRDFDIILSSGNKAMDHEVEQALHQTTQFPPPPDYILHGKTELVTEWELTVHPGLALAQGMPTFSPFGPSIVFDLVTIVNPAVDLTPLEVNVALASYWTR